MPYPVDDLKLNYSFFHANSKILHRESTPDVNSAKYKSGHIQLVNEIIGHPLPYFTINSHLDNWIINNPNILKKYTMQPLSPVSGTSNELWFINDSANWMKPWIVPEVVTDNLNQSATAYKPTLYKQDGTALWSWDGTWWIDPYQGVVKFGDGFNPGDLGWGIPKVTCYVYVGPTLNDKIIQLTPEYYKYNSDYHGGPSTVHTITHNLDSMYLQVNTFVEDPVTNEWSMDIVGVTYVDSNTLRLELTESCNVVASVKLVKSF